MNKFYAIVVFDKLELSAEITRDKVEELKLANIDTFYRTYFGDIWPCGIFAAEQEAIDVVENNKTDIHENCYQYALIEEYDFGLYPHPLSCKLYKWDENEKKYRPTTHPLFDRFFSGFTFYH